MAGGVKKPVNIFRLKNLGEPKGVFNWRLWFAVMSFGLLGAARGIDEGLISGAFNSPAFKENINYYSYSIVERANIKADVSAMVQLGSVVGALIAFVLCDRLGRIQATRFLCLLWILGIAIFMVGGARGSLGAVYAGRLIAGLGVGQTPVVGPIYVAEIAPASIRGLCTCFFTGAVYLGILLAYFSNYGAFVNIPDESHNQWLVPTSLHIIMAGLILILMFFQLESPRHLIRCGRKAEAVRNLALMRRQPADGACVMTEINAIQAALDHELEATRGVGLGGMLKELLFNRSNLYRFYLATSVQFLSQWSGAGSITLYAVDFFRILGVSGHQEGLLFAAAFGVVKFVAAMSCALFLVDVIGRKRSLLIGITLQSLAMIYVACFLTAVPGLSLEDHHSELTQSNQQQSSLPPSAVSASRGAIAMIFLSGIGWALGWNSMQYLLTAELFPIRIRALATSWAMMLHFANQYGNSRAVPNMLLPLGSGGISPRGTFWFFAVVTVFGGLWVLFSVPETGGRSLENMDGLFDLPWYKIGLRGNRNAELQDAAAAVGDDEKVEDVSKKNGLGEHVEETKTPRTDTVQV